MQFACEKLLQESTFTSGVSLQRANTQCKVQWQIAMHAVTQRMEINLVKSETYTTI